MTTINAFYDDVTATLTYVVYDENTKDAVVIDPVLDYEPHASNYSTESIDKVDEFIKTQGLKLHFILESHAHADHLTGSQFLKERYPEAVLGIGANIKLVQKSFKHVFNFKECNENGVQFDRLFGDNEVFHAGSLTIKVLYTPGHTPACVSYLINDGAVFTGDVLFMHDYGTGRCDFPGGSSEAMFDSVTQRLYTLPDDVKVYVGHDYKPGGRDVQYESTIGEQKRSNPQLDGRISKAEFVANRDSRDATLKAPRLLLQSLQVNIEAGVLPAPEDNGKRYLKMPIKPAKGY